MLLLHFNNQTACIGPQSQSTACQGSTLTYSAFSSWSQCSVSCGPGIQTRVAVSVISYRIIPCKKLKLKRLAVIIMSIKKNSKLKTYSCCCT